ncbi:MAG: lmo0937 family membrane protein [Chitinophagales bacterium]
MRSILYIIAVILIISWAISVFGYGVGVGAGYLIHILLVLAVISILVGIIRKGGV